MTLEERISKLLLHELQNNIDLYSPEFKVTLDTLYLTHCSVEHLSGDERTEAKNFKDKVWDSIQDGEIQLEYLTQNKIILPEV